MQNLGSVYFCGSPFVMSRTDAQNGLHMVFKRFGNTLLMIYIYLYTKAAFTTLWVN
jgi:hypothetical protein